MPNVRSTGCAQPVAVCCSVLQSVAVCCSCVSVCCSVLQLVPVPHWMLRILGRHSQKTALWSIKGGPEPCEKEINEILGSQHEELFSNPFFELVQKNVNFVFHTCFGTISSRAHGLCESSRRIARRQPGGESARFSVVDL